MISKEQLIIQVTPLLKEIGFKKRKLTWYLHQCDTTIVFNIQNSQFNNETYYINLGTNINKLNDTAYPTVFSCGVWQRINTEFNSSDQIVKTVKLWIEWYGDLDAIRKSIAENRMPSTTQNVVYSFLSKY